MPFREVWTGIIVADIPLTKLHSVPTFSHRSKFSFRHPFSHWSILSHCHIYKFSLTRVYTTRPKLNSAVGSNYYNLNAFAAKWQDVDLTLQGNLKET